MISFDSQQLQAIDSARMEAVLNSIVDQMKLQYADAPSAAELRLQLQPLVEQVANWGIKNGSFYALHVLACKVVGRDYFKLPGFESVLSDKAISDQLKEEWLGGWLSKLFEIREKKGR